jgi:L-erythro-3,5-diaminohexanoate dehydrogenase
MHMTSATYSPHGLHRVVSPPGALPQAADVLDPSPEVRGGEVLVDVERLNLDAASFRQLHDEQGGDPEGLRKRVLAIVEERGKMHNPVTGSGGMLLGSVRAVGPDRNDLRPGERIASLVSLTLTPLAIEDISAWDGSSEQVPIRGHAILFESSGWARLPDDLPDELTMAVLDVAGAPAWVHRLASGRDRTVVVGAAGKSGLLSMAAARGRSKAVAGLVRNEEEAEVLRALGFGEVAVADARDPWASQAAAEAAWTGGADLVVNCVDVPGTEGATILLAAQGGTVLFFSMATSFTSAALIAEGLGKDVTMLIGAGYVPGHAELALGLVRGDPALRAALEDRYRAGPAG